MIKRKIITDTKYTDIPAGLSPVQLKILHYLLIHSKETVFQRDVEKLIESRRSTTSGIINTMEKNKLLIIKKQLLNIVILLKEWKKMKIIV